MSYPSGNNIPRTLEDWVVYARQRGRALARTVSYDGKNIHKLAKARFSQPEVRGAFIAAFLDEQMERNSKSEVKRDA